MRRGIAFQGPWVRVLAVLLAFMKWAAPVHRESRNLTGLQSWDLERMNNVLAFLFGSRELSTVHLAPCHQG